MKFALYFGNRGFMPGELITGARQDMVRAVTDAGYEYIAMDRIVRATVRSRRGTRGECTTTGSKATRGSTTG